MKMSGNCSEHAIKVFSENIQGQLLRVNAMLVASVIVTGVMVGIGVYGQRYRHHPLTRFLFLGANILFLPILSYVVSPLGNENAVAVFSNGQIISGYCPPKYHVTFLVQWASLVLLAGIDTTAMVVGDYRKDRDIAPPSTVLIVQAIWISYLTVNFIRRDTSPWYLSNTVTRRDLRNTVKFVSAFYFAAPFVIIIVKLLFKSYAWYKARGSLEFGRNPHLIVGYMEQLKNADLASSEQTIPPLIVTGEYAALVEKHPHGYSPKWRNNNDLVTIDRVWQLEDDTFPKSSTKELQDICFSFALFKLLRCRFAMNTIAENGFMKAHNFIRHVLLQDGDDERAFRVIAHELSFFHDYYYSSLPITYLKGRLPHYWRSIFFSFWVIGTNLLNLFYAVSVMKAAISSGSVSGQISCVMDCSSDYQLDYGNWYFDLVPAILLAALVVLAEVREISSDICSNWTKVALICRRIRLESPLSLNKLLGPLLRCKWKLLNHWGDKMNQCSVLALQPCRTPMALLRHHIPLLDKKKVPKAVKTAVLKSLRSHGGNLSNGVASLCTRLHLETGNNPLSPSSGVKGIAYIILVCHIATSILEVSSDLRQPYSAHKIAATHLSRYCAYLVTYAPELLADDEEWCKSLYKTVQKEAKRALAGGVGAASTREAECQRLIQALISAGSDQHHVLKNGAELGKKLVEMAAAEGEEAAAEEEDAAAGREEAAAEGEEATAQVEDAAAGGEEATADGEEAPAGGEEAAWEVLADFWSEMILYAAPSDNFDAHAEAVARGGELITLLWTLLTHLGVSIRPDTAGSAGALDAV